MSEELLEEIRDELRELNGKLSIVGWTICGISILFIVVGIISFFRK